MDKIENYRRILGQTVKRHAQFQPANGEIATYAVCDCETDNYMVVDAGWDEKGRRIYDATLHFRLQGDGIRIERDTTDAEVVRELIAAGVVKDDITLAYNAQPYQKLNDSIAA